MYNMGPELSAIDQIIKKYNISIEQIDDWLNNPPKSSQDISDCLGLLDHDSDVFKLYFFFTDK